MEPVVNEQPEASSLREQLDTATAEQQRFEARRQELVGRISDRHREFTALARDVARGNEDARRQALTIKSDEAEISIELEAIDLALKDARDEVGRLSHEVHVSG